MADVRTLSGRKIDWTNPPKRNAKVMWSKKTSGGKPVIGSFRSICHLNWLNNLAKKKYGQEIVVFQSAFNSTVAASAGTHDFDACFDLYIPGVSWWEQQKFFRAHGFGCWYRHGPLFSNHIHGFTLPPVGENNNVSDNFREAGLKVGKFVDGGYSLFGKKLFSSQIEDYYNRAFALSGQHGRGSDKSWYPADIDATVFNLRAYVERREARQRRAA